jgi:hypothetical protein
MGDGNVGDWGSWYLFSYFILYAGTKCVSVETNSVSVGKKVAGRCNRCEALATLGPSKSLQSGAKSSGFGRTRIYEDGR